MENAKIKNIILNLLEFNDNYAELVKELELNRYSFNKDIKTDYNQVVGLLKDIKTDIKAVCEQYKVTDTPIDSYINNILENYGLSDSIYYVVNDQGVSGDRLDMKITRLAQYLINNIDTQFHAPSYTVALGPYVFNVNSLKTTIIMVESFKLVSFITLLQKAEKMELKQMYCVEAYIVILKMHLIIGIE